MDERYIATVDLGTSKTAVSVSRVEGKNTEVLYYRESPSDGVRYSCVFNPKRAGEAVQTAIRNAEDELCLKINQVVIGLPRYGVEQESRTASTERSEPDKCIEQEEIDSLKSMALDSYPLADPEKMEIYGAVAQSFNGDDSINLPEYDVVGSTSRKLEGNFKVFVGAKKGISNIDSILNNIGVAPARKYFLPGAVAEAVLTMEEKDNGVALVEIGGGVSSVTIYHNGILRFYHAIPFGGKNITNDIKYECGFREQLCENIKLGFGACISENLQNLSEKIIQVNFDEEGTNKQVPVKYLSEIITARMKEIYEALLFIIQESGYSQRLRSGIVLTGGCASLANAGRLLERMSGYTVRIGFPRCKNINVSACPEICEPSAAATVAMIMVSKGNQYINCTSEPQETDKSDIGYEGTVFDSSVEIVDKPSDSKQKKGGRSITWTSQLKKGMESAFNSTMGTLFDNINQ